MYLDVLIWSKCLPFIRTGNTSIWHVYSFPKIHEAEQQRGWKLKEKPGQNLEQHWVCEHGLEIVFCQLNIGMYCDASSGSLLIEMGFVKCTGLHGEDSWWSSSAIQRTPGFCSLIGSEGKTLCPLFFVSQSKVVWQLSGIKCMSQPWQTEPQKAGRS